MFDFVVVDNGRTGTENYYSTLLVVDEKKIYEEENTVKLSRSILFPQANAIGS